MSDERLLLDTMLGKLTTYLRMCGYDAAYAPERGIEADDAILNLGRSEDRRVVTRDAPLAARADDPILVFGREIEEQLREVRAAGLTLELAEPGRCSRCNGELETVKPVEDLPDDVPNPDEQTVWQCRACGQYFWKGSHWDDVAARLATV